MSFFSGEYECKVDAKGRIVLPARLKARLPEANGGEIVIKRGFEPCLVIYPMMEWKKIFMKVAGLNEFSAEYRNFQRNFFRGATEAELDAAGRFLLPKTLMKHADIESDVLVIGMGNRLEIWNPEKYDEFLIKDEGEFSDLAEKFLTNPES